MRQVFPAITRESSFQEGEATLEDLGSKNGTYIGGHQVTKPHRLANGDQIRFGSVVITFRIPDPPGSTETAP